MAPELWERTEDAEEDFLRQVQGLVAIAQQVEREGVHHSLMRRDEVGAGGFIAGHAALDHRRFTGVYVGPANDASVFHQTSKVENPLP